ncbi:hypothetical protein ACHQM5_016201 [Ranunculus cassubicifolius]
MAWLSLLVTSILCLILAILISTKLSNDSRKLPPGPKGWPVIGNMLEVRTAPYSALANLSQIHGPVMWVKLGSIDTMVISSSEAAAEMFSNQHDLSFAGRTTKVALRVRDFHQASLIVSQYGPYWRLLRGIYNTKLMTDAQINHSKNVRAKCMDMVIRWITKEADEKGSVGIARFVSLLSMNMIGNVALSKESIVDPNTKEGSEFFTTFKQGIELIAATNFADLFPILQKLDPQSIESNGTETMGRILNYVLGFVNERVSDREKGLLNSPKDILDLMLEHQGTDKDTEIPMENFGILITELLVGSTDSSTTTIEWALAELLKSPNLMKTLQEELDNVVGPGNKVEEDHIEKLKFLQAVIKETLRLHAPVPLLLPRRAMEDTQFRGYVIPKDTQILVNVWAIGRDPVNWEDPLVFKPERFLSSSRDYRGQNFEFLPFGGGQRMCAGVKLADRILHLSLGTFIHSFEWALESGTTPENIDMSERMGFTLQKRESLKVVLKPRKL